jgi:hypothetical protein
MANAVERRARSCGGTAARAAAGDPKVPEVEGESPGSGSGSGSNLRPIVHVPKSRTQWQVYPPGCFCR